MQKGDILLHEKFKFTDGKIGTKLIVILNNPNLDKNESYLVCRTTSNQTKKIKSPACDHNLSTFFIPANKDFFDIDTWLQLHEIFSFEISDLLNAGMVDKILEKLGELSEDTLRQLMNCVKKIKDISIEHKDLILNS